MKNVTVKIILIGIILSLLVSCSTKESNDKSYYVQLETQQGSVQIKLYAETPLHKKNFEKLINEKYFDGLLFHKIRNNIMLETGDPDSKNASPDKILGSGSYGKTIPAEINEKFTLKKGALIALRVADNKNPKKESSGSQFAIITGRKYTDAQLDALEYKINTSKKEKAYEVYLKRHPEADKKIQKLQASEKFEEMDTLYAQIDRKLNIKEFKLTPEQRKIYKEVGGVPYLKQKYTIFGEVTKGFDVLDKISEVEVDENYRPTEDIKIKMKLVENK